MIHHLGQAALMSAGMIWQTAWSLILGFSISAFLQATVSSADMQRAFGRDGPTARGGRRSPGFFERRHECW